MASTRFTNFTFVFSSLSLKEKEAVLEKLELKCQEEGYHLHLGLKAQFFKIPPPWFSRAVEPHSFCVDPDPAVFSMLIRFQLLF